jgi:hypothetical protein
MPQPFYSRGKSPWYPINRRLGWPQSQSGQWWREKFPATTRTQTPDCPDCSPALYHCTILASYLNINNNLNVILQWKDLLVQHLHTAEWTLKIELLLCSKHIKINLYISYSRNDTWVLLQLVSKAAFSADYMKNSVNNFKTSRKQKIKFNSLTCSSFDVGKPPDNLRWN